MASMKDFQQDLFGARAARDEALNRVEANAGTWIDQAFMMVLTLPTPWEGIFETIRIGLIARGLPPPHTHKAWGALCSKLIKAGVLHPTGRLAHMETIKSHGRKSEIYTLRGPKQ